MRRYLLIAFFLLGTIGVSAQFYGGRENEEARRKAYNVKHKKPETYRPTFFDYLSDESSFGGTYNYGKHFPIGFSINGSYSMFMGSLDFGINLSKDKFVSEELNTHDTNNYSKSTISLDPLFFATFTPSFYIRYFSVGCGIGFLYSVEDKEKYIQSSNTSSSSSDGIIDISHSKGISISSIDSSNKLNFMIRPSVKGLIPISEEISISLSVGYDYVFKFKEMNGLNFGLGVQFHWD